MNYEFVDQPIVINRVPQKPRKPPPWYKPKELPLGVPVLVKTRNDYGVELRFLRGRGDDGIDVHFDVIICFPDSSDTRRIPFAKKTRKLGQADRIMVLDSKACKS